MRAGGTDAEDAAQRAPARPERAGPGPGACRYLTSKTEWIKTECETRAEGTSAGPAATLVSPRGTAQPADRPTRAGRRRTEAGTLTCRVRGP
ncbi:hypothetical protein GCM10027074_65760 [Streptomyces deserti]